MRAIPCSMTSYLFSTLPRQLEEFEQMCAYHQTSPESLFTRQRLCTLPTADGRISRCYRNISIYLYKYLIFNHNFIE